MRVRTDAGGRRLSASHRPPSSAARPLLVLATLAGVGIGPGIAAGASVGGAAPPVVAAAGMTVLTVIGIAGLVISAVRWATARRRIRPEASAAEPAGPAAAFGTLGQRASFVLAAVELLILAVAAPLVLVLRATGPQEGPGEGVAALFVAALALVAISALIVPTIAAQVAWTWRPETPAVEAAVLAGTTPGPRRLVLVARTVAVTAWVLSVVGAATTSVLLTTEATARATAIAHSYSRAEAATALRDDLVGEYVVGDIRCPGSLPHPGRPSVFTCRVTGLGRTVPVRARWSPSGFGYGDVDAVDPAHAGLPRVADLPGPAPTAVPLRQDAPANEIVAAVRAQLLDEGWPRSSRAVRQLRCPSVGADGGDDASFFRCTIGRDPATQRSLDVYPAGPHRFVARTAEIADLPR